MMLSLRKIARSHFAKAHAARVLPTPGGAMAGTDIAVIDAGLGESDKTRMGLGRDTAGLFMELNLHWHTV